jgi:ubiquinone/menaquinone biosynthesis C-methylase UbiE
MANLPDALTRALRRARTALKRFAYSGPGRDRWQQPDRVVAELGLRPGDRVADLGAGGGYFTPHLARAVAPSGVVYAVDTDRDMLAGLADLASQPGLGNVVAVEAAPQDPGLPGTVDLVFLANAYHHLPDRPAYLATIARYLEPSGRVAVVEARVAGLRRLVGHGTSPETIRSELDAAGYTMVAEPDFLARQSFLVFQPRRAAAAPGD